MTKKSTTKRAILIFLVVLLFCLLISNYIYRDLLFWHGARFGSIATLSVDFSKPGTYNISYDYLGGGAGPFFALDVPKKSLSNKTPEELLSGLQGTYYAIDKDGNEFLKGSLIFDKKIINSRYSNHLIGLCYSHTEYIDYLKINISINQGAPQLKGIQQRLVLMDSFYNPAGFDNFGSLFFTLIFFTAATILTIFIVNNPRKNTPKNNQEIVKPIVK